MAEGEKGRGRIQRRKRDQTPGCVERGLALRGRGPTPLEGEGPILKTEGRDLTRRVRRVGLARRGRRAESEGVGRGPGRGVGAFLTVVAKGSRMKTRVKGRKL